MPRLHAMTAWALLLSGALLSAGGLAGCAAAQLGRAETQPGPGTPPGAEGSQETTAEAGRAALLRFARALEAGRWAEAWPLLSARWRATTTPDRLAADYRAAGPVAREASGRVAGLLESGTPLEPPVTPGAQAALRLPVGGGRAARLVLEPGGWRVDALE